MRSLVSASLIGAHDIEAHIACLIKGADLLVIKAHLFIYVARIGRRYPFIQRGTQGGIGLGRHAGRVSSFVLIRSLRQQSFTFAFG